MSNPFMRSSIDLNRETERAKQKLAFDHGVANNERMKLKMEEYISY